MSLTNWGECIPDPFKGQHIPWSTWVERYLNKVVICVLSLPIYMRFCFIKNINLFVNHISWNICDKLHTAKMKFNKAEIHKDAYHNHHIPLLPYKATVEFVASLGGVLVLAV